MSAPISQQLTRAQNSLQLARTKIALRHANAVLAAKGKFDVLEGHSQKKRRQATIERMGEDKILRVYDRLRAINLCRDLERNFTSAKSIMGQIRTNVVGTGPKVRVHGADEAASTEAAEWFNSDWQPTCDYRDGRHYADQLADAVAAVVREGDILQWFDGGFLDDSGKIGWFEADQLCEVQDPQSLGQWASATNDSGVFFDKMGRVLAYACSAKHGQSSALAADVTVLPRDAVARLIKLCWRPGQLRGTSLMLTTAADLQDLYEMRAKELQTAKVGASVFATAKKKNAVDELAMKRDGWTETGGATDGATTGGLAAYERLEAFTGGLMEYMDADEDIELMDFNRPSVNFRESHDHIASSAGSAMGLAKTHTLLRVEASYTAFRGELLLSWATFCVLQKMLERQSCDWTARNAIDWAIRHKKVTPFDLSRARFSWAWPSMPAVDPLKDSSATENNLRMLLTDYAAEIGPDWRKRFDALREQAAYAKAGKSPLPLMIWEAEKAGLRFDGAPSAKGTDAE